MLTKHVNPKKYSLYSFIVRLIGRLLIKKILHQYKINKLNIIFKGHHSIEYPTKIRSCTPSKLTTIELNSLKTFLRLGLTGHIGAAKAYILSEWDCDELVELFSILNNTSYIRKNNRHGFIFCRLLARLKHKLRNNSIRGSRKNVKHHYDLGNDFFECWLDKGLTYSSALFTRRGVSLEVAQERKYRMLAESLGLNGGMEILEIGCGWGGFAEFVIREYDCRYTGITISQKQREYAGQRLARSGLSERAEIQLLDYRNLKGKYDRIVSIEMFEAVGERYWCRYFEKLHSLLKPKGRVGLQVITIKNERFESYRKNVDFIQAYVFPGGMLPSPLALENAASTQGLTLTESYTFGESYAATLNIWRSNFEKSIALNSEKNLNKQFCRMWRYYLAYCEAGFRSGNINVGQYFLAHV